jgi:hypothetical protein
MKIKYIALIFATLPVLAVAATVRSGSERVSLRPTTAVTAKTPGARMPNMSVNTVATGGMGKVTQTAQSGDESAQALGTLNDEECRETYRACMDEFCLMDESEGERCACSDNIRQAKNIIQEIQKIQSEAETLYTEGVEREKLGARADWVFGATNKPQESSLKYNLYEWMYGGQISEELSADDEIGNNLYAMAAESCENILARCDDKTATREEQLYSREITKNCKAFDVYLADQKRAAESNLRTAQAAVRSTRASLLDKTDKYNRGECLLAYRSCIADKGGCGVEFENCLDDALLQRRANACENILDQCMRSREYVLEDWAAESQMILDDAAKYVDRNMRATCEAKTRNCLEESCSTSTDTLCLNNIEVAAGICPIIDECDAKAPGFKASWKDKLASLKTDFCQNDVTKCMQDKCGVNYDAPQCTGKDINELVALCPQKMFVSCKGEGLYDQLVAAVKLNLNYQQLENCMNYYADLMGRTCGADMACLPGSKKAATYTSLNQDYAKIQTEVEKEAHDAVAQFFSTLRQQQTVKDCISVNGNSDNAIAAATKYVAEARAKARYAAELDTQRMKLIRASDIETARKACYNDHKIEKRPSGNGNFSYVTSVSFEPALRNCHVCRKQRVCSVGGEDSNTGALKGAAAGLTTGLSAGSMFGPWGTAIGAVVGGVGGGIAGYNLTGEKESCQELESCEDVNYGDIESGLAGSGGSSGGTSDNFFNMGSEPVYYGNNEL